MERMNQNNLIEVSVVPEICEEAVKCADAEKRKITIEEITSL